MPKLRVDIWSDIACPWCYVGKRRFEAALARFPHRRDVEIVWRAFELDPSAPRARQGGAAYAERLAKKYGTPLAEAEGMITRMTEVAAADGLAFHFERIRPGNTFDAHRLVHLALEHGVQDAMKERLLRAYMTEGEDLGDQDVLLRLAGEAGLDQDEARAVLTRDSHAAAVRADEEEARALGINGVPFFVFANRIAVSGAQPADLMLEALTQAWTTVSGPTVMGEEGAVCGPDGCA